MYKNSKVAVIIAAAGQGKRLGAPVPKQYLKIGGEYVIAKTIRAFEDIDEVDYIFVVTNDDYRKLCAEIAESRGFSKVEGIVAGGSRRQDSVFNAIQEINAKKPGVSLVLIHDGARPFVGKDVILNVLEETENTGAAVACVAMKNSVRRMDSDGSSSMSVDRSDYYSVQTPQGFRKSMLIEAYDKAFDEGFAGTDEEVEAVLKEPEICGLNELIEADWEPLYEAIDAAKGHETIQLSGKLSKLGVRVAHCRDCVNFDSFSHHCEAWGSYQKDCAVYSCNYYSGEDLYLMEYGEDCGMDDIDYEMVGPFLILDGNIPADLHDVAEALAESGLDDFSEILQNPNYDPERWRLSKKP